MAKRTRQIVIIAAFAAAAGPFFAPAFATSYLGPIPVGESENFFQIGSTSNLLVDISALGTRDPTICASCYSQYTDNYTVLLLDQSGTLLSSVHETNYFYYNMYSSSYGIGAGPVSINVPAGATTLEIQSQLYVAGLLGTDGLPLSFGELNISSNGSIAAVTPIPTALPLFLTGLIGLLAFAWRAGRQGLVPKSMRRVDYGASSAL
jgi:hypothetical protein